MKDILQELSMKISIGENFIDICRVVNGENLESIDKETTNIINKLKKYSLSEIFEKTIYNGFLGQYYTTETVVNLVHQIMGEQNEKKIYDPTCGSGNLLMIKNGENKIYGQELSETPLKIAQILMPKGNFKHGDTLKKDAFCEEKFDFVLANPPFNQKNWGLEELEDDPRWKWGTPPKNNANYAWISHCISKLKTNGQAIIILANGSLSGAKKDEIAFRKRVIEDNKVEMIISLPDKLFANTTIPVCIWVINNNKKTKDVLFVDASNVEGTMMTKKLRVLNKEDIMKLRGELESFRNGNTIEEVGYSKSVTIDEIKESDYSFVPGRYVGFVKEEIDKEQLKQDIKESSKELKRLFTEFTELIPQVEEAIEKAISFEGGNCE